jgi:hypothetical protein
LEDIFTGINVTLPSSAQRLQIVAQPAELGSPPQDVQVESCFSNRKERTKQVDTLEINTVEREATGEHLQSSHYQLGSLASVLCHTASVSPRSGGTCSGGAEVDPNSDSKGGKKSKGGRRDSDKPKRPRTAYLLFAEDCRRGLKKTDPALSFTATSQMVSKEWKELAETKKVQYQRTAEKEQEKHRVAKAQWEAKQVLEAERTLAMERSLALEGSLVLGGLLTVEGSLEGAGLSAPGRSPHAAAAALDMRDLDAIAAKAIERAMQDRNSNPEIQELIDVDPTQFVLPDSNTTPISHSEQGTAFIHDGSGDSRGGEHNNGGASHGNGTMTPRGGIAHSRGMKRARPDVDDAFTVGVDYAALEKRITEVVSAEVLQWAQEHACGDNDYYKIYEKEEEQDEKEGEEEEEEEEKEDEDDDTDGNVEETNEDTDDGEEKDVDYIKPNHKFKMSDLGSRVKG